MATWHENDKTKTRICIHNPVRTAYLIIFLLEKERVPRCCVDEVFDIVNDILRFQEVTHTEADERRFSGFQK